MWTDMSFTTMIFFFFFLIAGLWIGRTIYRDKKRQRMMNNFANYTAILEYYMEKAYDIIHKDKILIYSIEATKLPDKDFNRFTKEFIKLVEKLLGKQQVKEFVFFYSEYDTFIFNVVEYFNSKYETDEIRQTAMDNVMDSELEVPDSLKATPPKAPAVP